MSETNGQGKSRLDQIEEMIARSEAANERYRAENEAAHERFEEEDKRLLTSQILMNGALQKMAAAMERTDGTIVLIRENMVLIEENIVKIENALDRFAEGMISLELKMEETTGKLNALIDTVDGIIRRKPE